MSEDHGPSIKDDDPYEALREEGASKEKAACIANTPDGGAKGGQAPPYEKRTVDELFELARKIGITGRSQIDSEAMGEIVPKYRSIP